MTFEDMPSPEGESNPVVFVDHGQVRATSRDVARYFGKRHDNVVRAIRSIVAEAPELDGLTFEGIEYLDNLGRRRPAFSMDRDGFTMLAMGFTGKDARRFQWAYIQAFNRMEADLRGQVITQPRTDHRDLSAWPVEEMRAKTAIVEMYRRAGGPLTAMWAMPQVGFPLPPSSMIEIGRQLLLDLVGGGPKEPEKDE
jgi:Rha family phage regulatory protein